MDCSFYLNTMNTNILVKLIIISLFINYMSESKQSERRLNVYAFRDPDFSNVASIQATASNPWPHTPEKDNLCLMSTRGNMKVTIVMASDRRYYQHQAKCLGDGDPVAMNTVYANLNGYALRMYIDEDVPFIMKFGRNAMMGELRKIFGLADALHPEGPRHGYWTTKAKYINPEAVMWVDGDATLSPFHGVPPLTVEQVVARGCSRSEYPLNYVRILAQDSGNNVNAGWYLISGGLFGAHFVNYLVELAEVYEPCGMWGQHVIQEALLVVMAGTSPDKWPLALPCSGEKYHCFDNQTFHSLLHECDHNKECVIHKGAAYTNGTNYHLLAKSPGPGLLNGCFDRLKWTMSPNGQACWERAQAAIEKQGTVTDCKDACCAFTSYPTPRCNNGGKEIPSKPSTPSQDQLQSPFAEPSNRYWGASGAGVVLLNVNDPETQFNFLKIHTQFLWHHGHGRLAVGCDLWRV